MIDSAALSARLADIRERIARAASRVGRDPASIRLVAVSKTFPPEHIRAAAQLGQVDFGENKVQEALSKMDQLGDLALRWHLIGHLQSNKARRAARFDAVHSVDGPQILQRLDEVAREAGRVIDLLVQVDLAREPTKHGVQPADLAPVLEAAGACRAARLTGLMLLPPAAQEAEDARPYFAALRRLRDELRDRGVPASLTAELSMGMSHDFEVAIEEGATIVRIGSALFGARSGPAGPR